MTDEHASKENRVSDKRLAELAYSSSLSPHLSDQLAAFRELQSLRSKPVAGLNVKALEWEIGEARSAIGLLSVHRFEAPSVKWSVRLNGTALQLYAESEKRACALAQEYLNERILSALSLPAHDPVAWRGDSNDDDEIRKFTAIERVSEIWTEQGLAVTPLYASPQPEAVITEEMVERAATALAKSRGVSMVDEVDQFMFRRDARAALTAALKEA